MKEITFVQAINEAVDEEMQRDPSVFILGEDVGKAWGAALGEFMGLFDKYGPIKSASNEVHVWRKDKIAADYYGL